jgi:hypothetical protein
MMSFFICGDPGWSSEIAYTFITSRKMSWLTRRRLDVSRMAPAPGKCEAVLAVRAREAPPREVFVPKPAPRRGLPKPWQRDASRSAFLIFCV